MPRRKSSALLFSLILTVAMCGSSLAALTFWENPELLLADPRIGPDSELPPIVNAIPYIEPDEPQGVSLGETYLLGTTWYDHQHNGTNGKMVALTPGRGVHFCWMNGLQALATERHIYYNYWYPVGGNLNWPDVGYQVDQGNRAGYTTLSQFSGGEAVIAYHARQNAGDAWRTQVAWDFIEGFGAFQMTYLDNVSGWDELMWPRVAVCSQDYIHVVSCEDRTEIWQRIAYARSQNGGVSYTPFAVVDTIVSISQDVAASPVSNKVGIAYCKSEFDVMNLGPYDGLQVSLMNNGVALIESDNGTTWNFTDRQDITNLVEPDSSRYPDSTWANGDTLRAYCDVSLLYDQADNAHVAFTTRGLWFDARLAAHPDSFAATRMTRDASMIWHWSEQHDTITVVADGWYDVGDPDAGASEYRGSGSYRSTVDRPSLGQDPTTGYLYCTYQRCAQGDTSGGPVPSHGWANGEIYCSVSTDGGLNWSEGTNLTQTPSPGCFFGNCMDEDYSSLAAEVNDTLHIIYVEDKDAGGVVLTAPQEGSWTENPVRYLRVPASLIPPGPPYVPNFSFHVGPEEQVPVVLTGFEAIAGQGSIALQWATASEVNCHRWEIYRGEREGGEYQKVGELSGHGSTETAHTYRWIDRLVTPQETYFYRLKQVDFDGTSWWSQVVSVTVRSAMPVGYALHQNYPNPFNPETIIRFDIPHDCPVSLSIYSVTGQLVRELTDGYRHAGSYEIRWDGRGADGNLVTSGIYFCRMRAGEFTTTRRMALIK